MGYSKYKRLKTVVKKFNLDALSTTPFETVTPCPPSIWLADTLKKSRIVPLNTEKSKAKRIISPILVEIAEFYQESVTLFSGEALDVNIADDLAGACDFFFVLHPHKPYIESPIISLVESKNEDMEYGRAQCAAQLYGAKLYNEAEGKEIPVLYGCATDGVEWQFIRFENNIFFIDNRLYTHLDDILGVWHKVVQSYLKKKDSSV